jgi:HSP20 family protein
MAETTTLPATGGTASVATTPASARPADSESGKLRRRDAVEAFESLQDAMSRFWSQSWPFGSWPLARRAMPMPEGTALWVPKIDVFEKNGDLVVKAELPGAKKEDIEVTLDDGSLVIRGEKKSESDVTDEHYYRTEQSYGTFYRRLALPFETTADQIQATYTGGVLEVHIPTPIVEAKPEPKSITII